MTPQEGGWLPPWFQQWINAVYNPAHIEIDKKLSTLTEQMEKIAESQHATADALQKMVSLRELEAKQRATVIGFIREWGNPILIAGLILTFIFGWHV